MKGKNLLILFVLAAALGAAAFLMRRRDTSLPPEDVGKLLMPGLAVNDIEKVIIDTGSATITLARVEKTWVCADRYNYPIDLGRLRKAILDIYELKIGDVIPGAAERLKFLGMIPPGQGSGSDAESGTLVQLFVKGASAPRSVLLGKTHTKNTGGEGAPYGGTYADGRYVSTDGGKTVYLVSETLGDLTADNPTQWLDTDLFSVSSSDIREIEITGPKRDPIKIARAEDNSDLEVEGMQEDEEVDSAKLNNINAALSYLKINDVADPALPDEQVGMTSAVVYRVTTKKDEIYTVRIGASPKDSSDYYVRIDVAMAAEAEAAEEVDEAAAPESDEATEAGKKEEEKSRQETANAVETLNKKLSGWTYLISYQKAESFTVKRSDLVKKKEEEKKDEEK